jgi:hypothetical protein
MSNKTSAVALEATTRSPIAELPPKLRPAAKSVAASLAKLGERYAPLEAAKVVMAVVQDHLAKAGRRQSGLAAAVARGVLAREELKAAEGGSLSAEETRTALGGISKEAVLKRYRKGRLLGWREARQNAVRFPAWQFVDEKPLPGLEEVLAVLNRSPSLDDWARILFFLNRRSSVGVERPLDLLRRGEIEPVKRAAAAYVE